jgi:RNA polymerase sigma factor (sigma-70 family)
MGMSELDKVLSAEPPKAFLPSAESASGSHHNVWDWETLDVQYRPKLIAAGIARFQLTQEECEDAVQTVFLRVLQNHDSSPRVQNIGAYLRTAFLNQCRDICDSKNRRWSKEVPIDDSGPNELRDERASSIADICTVAGAYKQVGPGCQKVIEDYCVESLTLAEISKQSGSSVTTIWKRVQGCLKRMRLCLES